MSERTLDVLRNYIAKHEHSTEPAHIRLVDFARRRLAEGLVPKTIPAYSKWDESVASAGKTPLFTDSEIVSYTNYAGYTTYYPLKEEKTSIFASVCRQLSWKGKRSMVHRAKTIE